MKYAIWTVTSSGPSQGFLIEMFASPVESAAATIKQWAQQDADQERKADPSANVSLDQTKEGWVITTDRGYDEDAEFRELSYEMGIPWSLIEAASEVDVDFLPEPITIVGGDLDGTDLTLADIRATPDDIPDTFEMAEARTAGEDVTLSGDDQFPLLQPGQHVQTPEGPGVITDIEIHAGRYGDRIEMEPPVVMVELDDEAANPRRIQVCICKLGLENGEHETIVSKEFGRLWPPVDTEIPESAHQLVDVETVEAAEGASMIRYRGSLYRRQGAQ